MMQICPLVFDSNYIQHQFFVHILPGISLSAMIRPLSRRHPLASREKFGGWAG